MRARCPLSVGPAPGCRCWTHVQPPAPRQPRSWRCCTRASSCPRVLPLACSGRACPARQGCSRILVFLCRSYNLPLFQYSLAVEQALRREWVFAACWIQSIQLLSTCACCSHGCSCNVGCVVANDIDAQRCNLLTHQVKRMCSPALVVTNHDASLFPLVAPKGTRKVIAGVLDIAVHEPARLQCCTHGSQAPVIAFRSALAGSLEPCVMRLRAAISQGHGE